MNTITPSSQPGCVLRLHIEGVEELGGDVRLGAFIEKLAALKAALSETAQLDGRNPGVDFLVSNLSHSSPAMVEITAVAVDNSSLPADVVTNFLRFVRQAGDRTIEVNSAHAKLVGQLRKLVAGTGERFQRLWLDGPNIAPIVLNDDVARALDDALPDVRKEIGTVKGTVKRYSGVGKRPYFKIVPVAGNVEVKCLFPQELLDQAAASVEHNVSIEGELKSYEGDLWPYEISVRSIVIHPSDDLLPTLSELAGSAPEATGELSVAEFVRGLRNEW
ncbi:hypothetical protein [Stenotrophomonas maltophilia]|uniref:hypothetical protein n=1 Tax=Stenotrophomonas maltophilia TaxID=40324 RepID=UPI0039C498F1